MICPECEKGMIVVLATKGQIHPHRETTILTHPERYFKKVPCPRCNGSEIAYCRDGEDVGCEADAHIGDKTSAEEAEPLVA